MRDINWWLFVRLMRSIAFVLIASAVGREFNENYGFIAFGLGMIYTWRIKE